MEVYVQMSESTPTQNTAMQMMKRNTVISTLSLHVKTRLRLVRKICQEPKLSSKEQKVIKLTKIPEGMEVKQEGQEWRRDDPAVQAEQW